MKAFDRASQALGAARVAGSGRASRRRTCRRRIWAAGQTRATTLQVLTTWRSEAMGDSLCGSRYPGVL